MVVVTRKRAKEMFAHLDISRRSGIGCRWVVILSGVTTADDKNIDKWDGWNGSFHEAQFSEPYIFVWGRSPARARKRAKNIKIVAVIKQDSCIRRHEARRMVRFGD